ncbi:MAG: Mur ligase family protein [Gammaproteobacteria bacterium]
MTEKAQRPGISLVELLREFDSSGTLPEIEIVDIVSNSRAVREGSLFIALQGINSHGIDFSIDATRAGAVAVLYDAKDEYCRQRIPLLSKQINANWIPLERLNQISGEIVSRFYNDPACKMKIIGVTGTDGKSSVTHLLTQALGRAGKIVGSIGTLGYGVGNQLEPTALTTPDAVTLQTWLNELYQQQCEYVVMEVSSHALDQFRVNGCHFDIAVLTNLGRDHLDYHGDRTQYAETKAKLFREFELSARVLNVDDDLGRKLSREFAAEKPVRYSASGAAADAEVSLLSSEVTDEGLDMRVATPQGRWGYKTAG